jgi:hypothetical protein
MGNIKTSKRVLFSCIISRRIIQLYYLKAYASSRSILGLGGLKAAWGMYVCLL